jgi:hypothetical protein
MTDPAARRVFCFGYHWPGRPTWSSCSRPTWSSCSRPTWSSPINPPGRPPAVPGRELRPAGPWSARLVSRTRSTRPRRLVRAWWPVFACTCKPGPRPVLPGQPGRRPGGRGARRQVRGPRRPDPPPRTPGPKNGPLPRLRRPWPGFARSVSRETVFWFHVKPSIQKGPPLVFFAIRGKIFCKPKRNGPP